MNRRSEHAGHTNRFVGEIKTETGGIPAGFFGIGNKKSSGGGVTKDLEPWKYTRIEGKLVYLEGMRRVEDIPPVAMIAELFDINSRYLGNGEHIGCGEFIDDELIHIDEVHFYNPIS